MPASDEAALSEGDGRRLVLRAAASLVAFLLCASVAAAVSVAGGGEGDSGAAVARTAPAGADGIDPGGPVVGEDVAGYVARRQADLRGRSGPLAGVASLDAYMTEGDARQLLRPAGVHVAALLAAVPGGRPAVVRDRLADWLERQRADAESERANLQSMLQDTSDPDFAAQFRADIARLTQLLADLDRAGPVVFGAVVDGGADALSAAAGTPGVRLVDPIGRAVPSALDRLRGLRPEETGTAGDPPTRPV